MSRHGYSDDMDDVLAFGRWRAQVASAARGRRGQRFFRDLIEALDAMPEKRLVAESFVDSDGECCTLGALARHRGIDVSDIDPDWGSECAEVAGARLDVARQLAAEAMYENDESVSLRVPVILHGPRRYPYLRDRPKRIWVPATDEAERRWAHMRAWAARHIRDEVPA